MIKRGQRRGGQWILAIFAGCLAISSVQAQQTTDSGEQGGFVVIEDTQPTFPPKPLALTVIPSASASSRTSAAAATPTAPARHFEPLPTLPPNALPLIERMPPATVAPRANAAPLAKPPTPPAPSWTWTVKQGYSIQQQLQEMGKKAHWNVVWNYPKDILAGADWTSHDDFPTAAEKIITILSGNGALIHYHTYTGNSTFLVYGTGSTP